MSPPQHPSVFSTDPYVRRFRDFQCLRIRVSDRKLVHQEREKVFAAAGALHRKAYISYKHPYLYAVLGEKVSEAACAASPHPGEVRSRRRA